MLHLDFIITISLTFTFSMLLSYLKINIKYINIHAYFYYLKQNINHENIVFKYNNMALIMVL